ncbi:efflux RND transporter periplasmic adaptor subunit [Pseudoalteromonas sp. DL2-H2.2]|uniref:efflux RND transporter periplasmic adaptor subunit n=1 Tax=Pseudoalteromonas sp. DL2-H2.2 TaxID=2908889 RepID=UPI001F2FE41A|nr:efflux RND transporter periplasmic adaptor subunit [Pseudoalteromonas sp. DL2-H2.2]MCF2909357.1 efflux RND transporter periplasmic adaptor subunit [Pseudoalteromonas sp. DL2-H2.2]
MMLALLNRNSMLLGLTLSIGIIGCKPVVDTTVETIRPIKAMEIGSGEPIAGDQIPGIARATQEVELSFRVSGTLQSMPIKIGQEVRIGDTLAELDKRDFEVALDNTRAALANAEAQLNNAKIEYDRVIRIQKREPGVVSQSTVDLRRTAYNSAKASYAAALAKLNADEDRLSYATLKAPFDGVIVQRYVENYQDINANSPIFRLVDISKIEMDINISESQISNLPYVKNPRVVFDAFPDIEIPARIKEVSSEASPATRTYKVRLIMKPPLGIDILPGMSGVAMADVNLPGQESQVVIPVSSVVSSADGATTYVWRYSQELQQVTKVEIETAGINSKGLVVTKGLAAGDWIATAGVHFLKEGQNVRLLAEFGGGR